MDLFNNIPVAVLSLYLSNKFVQDLLTLQFR